MPSPGMVRDAVRRVLDYPDIYTAALELQAEYAGYDARRKVLRALDELVGFGLYVGPREIHTVQPHQRKLWAVGGGR